MKTFNIAHQEYLRRNDQDWKNIHHSIFGENIPHHYEWNTRDEIIRVLNAIGKVKDSNHIFFPSGGGMDLEGAIFSHEKDCIELNAGVPCVLKPCKLVFESIDSDFNWDYFRVEISRLRPSGVYENYHADANEEEVLELSPLNYIKWHHWYDKEYQGREIPDSAREVFRILKAPWSFSKRHLFIILIVQHTMAGMNCWELQGLKNMLPACMLTLKSWHKTDSL